MENTNVLNALTPEVMNQLLEAKKAGTDRAAGSDPVSAVLKGILGQNADVSAAAETLNSNGLMQLFLGADGDIDAKELMDYVGNFSGGTGANPNNNAAVRALMDGKLDFKEILILLALLKLMKGGKKPAQTQTSGGLLNSLLGASTQSSSTASAMNLFQSMLGAQTAQPAYQSSLFGNLFGTQTAQPSNTQVFSFGNQSSGAGMNMLNALLSGNTGNNSQASQLYSLLTGNSANAFNSNGSVNVGTLFNIASALLGAK